MSTSRKSTPAAVTSSSVTEQLDAIEKSLVTVVSLTKVARRQLESRSNTVPDALILKMIQIAKKNGGMVAGMPFDADSASKTLTNVSNARAAADSSRTIAQKMGDQAVQQRIIVADRAFAIYRALDRLVKTPEGNSLLGTYEAMASTVKNRPRIPRKKKTTAEASAPAAPAEPTPAPEPPQATAPATATAVPAVPAASGVSHS